MSLSKTAILTRILGMACAGLFWLAQTAPAAAQGAVRSVQMEELAATSAFNRDVSFSGVRLDRIVRNADAFRQAEVRRTGADAARANAEVAGLENIDDLIADMAAGFDRLARAR